MSRQIQDIAIVGMGSHFPDAPTLYDFWSNIVSKKNSLRDIDLVDGDEYWRKGDYFDPDPDAPDKTYGYKAGFVPPLLFDPIEFKLPPLMLESISTAQLFALHVAKQAMIDAGMVGPRAGAVDVDRIGVILGGAGNGNTSFSLAARQSAPYLKRVMLGSGFPEAIADDVIARVKDLYLEWNEDSFPGFLGNVACGRIASYFNLGGTSYMVDAACASSLAAVKAAIGELTDGSCDAVLTGGINLENSIFSFLCFSKTPALSRSNQSRPFDADSDGMMLGDGIGIVVLKRLEDAVRHGDRIYSVIKALTASSDGRARSVFAPRSEGQVKAMKRAYERAAVSPADIQLIEAHGTGTQSGDNTELKSLQAVFSGLNITEQSIALGSIKSQIGHTRCAAGAAALMKVSLALHHKVLPPTINVKVATNSIDSMFYVNTESRPWIRPANGKPRRAALSAFGFGGTNYHAILEEYAPETSGPYRLNRQGAICVWHAPSAVQLLEECNSAHRVLGGAGSEAAFKELARASSARKIALDDARIVFVANDAAEAKQLLLEAIKQLEARPEVDWEHPRGIYYRRRGTPLAGRVVALFPGQGSQYVDMARGLAVDYPEMRRAVEEADNVAFASRLSAVSAVLYPPPALSAEGSARQASELTRTINAQPAIGAVSVGYFRLLQRMGFKPDFVAGHSYGEITALWCAGVLSDADFYKVSFARGQALELPAGIEAGAMLAAAVTETEANEILGQIPDLSIANCNAPEQVVLAGSTTAVERARDLLKGRNKQCQILPVAAAFHTSFACHALAPFKQSLAGINFSTPACTAFSTATVARHSSNPDEIRDALCQQLVQPVRFAQTIERIHAEGGYLFVEIGPKAVLGKLVAEILKGKPHRVVSLNSTANGEDAAQFRNALARLIAEGVELTNLDPYAREQPLAPPARTSTVQQLQGGFFLSQKSKERRRRALRTDTQKLDAFIAQQVSARSAQAPAPASPVSTARNTTMQNEERDERILSVLDAQIQAQNVLSQVHQQFQLNQKDYLQLLSVLTTNQCALLEKFQGSGQLAEVVSSLSHSLQLLERNQELYHVNHEHYFSNQTALFGAEPHRNGRVPLQTVRQSTPAPAQAATPTALSRPSAFAAPAVALPSHATSAPPSPAPVPAPSAPQALRPVAAEPAPAPIQMQSPASQSLSPIAAPTPTMPQMAPATATGTAAEPKAAAAPAASAKRSSNIDEAAAKRLAGLTEDDLIKQLIALVSDRTGYPSDMITEAMDLEADLGIDSIKRMEIFGAMFDRIAATTSFGDVEKLKETETFDVEAFSNIRKMAGFFMKAIAEILGDAPAPKPVEVTPTMASGATAPRPAAVQSTATPSAAKVPHAPPLQTSGQGAAGVTEFVTAPATRSKVRGFVASTRELTTVERSPEVASAKKSLAEQGAKLAPARRLLIEGSIGAGNVRRFEVHAKHEPPPDQIALNLAPGHIWVVTDDGEGLSAEVVRLLRAEHQKVALLTLPASVCDEAQVHKVIAEIEATEGKIGGFIHLQPRAAVAHSMGELFGAQDYETAFVVFTLAKLLQSRMDDQTAGQAYFCVVTQIDGQLGTLRQDPYSVVCAGLSGLAKSLHAEWEGVHSRAVDIDPQVERSLAATLILQELRDPKIDLCEVGRGPACERITLGLQEAPIDGGVLRAPDTDDSLFLVTGGARGITAECIVALAQRDRCRFALLGRTNVEATLPAWVDGAQDVNTLKAKAIRHLQSTGEQPTPVKIDRMLKDVLNVFEIKQTLQRIESAGAKALYLACDITDEADVRRAVIQAQETLGPIEGVIHGAGNLADKRIEKKTAADFHSVFHTKVKGLENVLKAVPPDTLRHLVLFSSVSGFFGNAGQTDYAMANESMNKLAHAFQWQYPQCAVRAINWGPWDSGMVSESLKKAYQQRNLAIVPTAVGASCFVNELQVRSAAPQIVVGGGNYKVARRIKAPVVRGGPVSRELKLQDNPFLTDHIIGGHPVLPATAAVGWAVKVGEDLLPGYHFESLQDFKVFKGIVFDSHECCVLKAHIRPLAAAAQSNPERHTLEISIGSDSGAETLNHYRAVVTLSCEERACPKFETADLSCVTPISRPIYGVMQQDALLFHGRSFRGVQSVLNVDNRRLTLACRLDPVEVAAQGRFRVSSFNPYLNDVFIQAPLAWLMLQTNRAGLPSAIGRIEQYRALSFAQPFYLSMEVVQHSQALLSTNIVAHDESGNIFSQLSDVQFTVSTRLRQVLNEAHAAA